MLTVAMTLDMGTAVWNVNMLTEGHLSSAVPKPPRDVVVTAQGISRANTDCRKANIDCWGLTNSDPPPLHHELISMVCA